MQISEFETNKIFKYGIPNIPVGQVQNQKRILRRHYKNPIEIHILLKMVEYIKSFKLFKTDASVIRNVLIILSSTT